MVQVKNKAAKRKKAPPRRPKSTLQRQIELIGGGKRAKEQDPKMRCLKFIEEECFASMGDGQGYIILTDLEIYHRYMGGIDPMSDEDLKIQHQWFVGWKRRFTWIRMNERCFRENKRENPPLVPQDALQYISPYGGGRGVGYCIIKEGTNDLVATIWEQAQTMGVQNNAGARYTRAWDKSVKGYDS